MINRFESRSEAGFSPVDHRKVASAALRTVCAERYGSGMSMDESNAEQMAGTLTRSSWGPAPLIPPPPTGPLAPPAPPPLAPELVLVDETAHHGTHRSESAAQPVESTPESDGQLPAALRTELMELLGRSGGRLQEVFDQYRGGATSPGSFVASGAALTEASAVDLVLRIQTILGQPWTGAPGNARPLADTARILMATRGLSDEARRYLSDVRVRMLNLAESTAGQQQELAQLEANSTVLESEIRITDGVFVYTYPHYWRHPYAAELNRRLLRLGRTPDAEWKQVLEHAQAAEVPERPVLLRVYAAEDPVAAEQTFHRLLNGADHVHTRTDSDNREWFATTLEFLDEISAALGCRISAGVQPVL